MGQIVGTRSGQLQKKVLSWLARAPLSAERLTLMAVGMPDQILMELSAEDAAKLQPSELAGQMADQALEWAESYDRECRFVAQWMRGEAPCLTLQFRAGNNYGGTVPGANFDGSMPDILGQMQRHLEMTQRTMVGSLKQVMDAQNYVIERQRLELEDARSRVLLAAEREEGVRADEIESLVENRDEEKLVRLVGLVTEAAKHLQAGSQAGANRGANTGLNTEAGRS